jgi:hypothetical protein
LALLHASIPAIRAPEFISPNVYFDFVLLRTGTDTVHQHNLPLYSLFVTVHNGSFFTRLNSREF